MDDTKSPSNPMWGNRNLDSPVTQATSKGTPGVTVPANQTEDPPQAGTSTPTTQTNTTPLVTPTDRHIQSTPVEDVVQQPLPPLPEQTTPLTNTNLTPSVQEQQDPTLPLKTHAQTLQGPQQDVPIAPIPQAPEQLGQTQQDPAQQNQIPTQFVYAGFFKRLVAVVLDTFILMVPITIISFLLILTGIMRAPSPDGNVDATFALIYYAIMPLISFGYYIYFIGAKGQTPGKKILGIKVIKKDSHEVPGYLGAFLREIVGKMLNGLIMGLGYWWMLWDKDKQTWADKIASTIVIKTK